jgi:hypothetical protein
MSKRRIVFKAMSLFGPSKPPPKKKKQAPDAAAAVRRRLTTDGFEAVRRPSVEMELNSSATELAMATAGLTRRLSERATVPREVTEELLLLGRGAVVNPSWHQMLRFVLSPPAPETPQQIDEEARRILGQLETTQVRVMRSWAVLRTRGLGISEAHFFRGADIVVVGGAALLEEFKNNGATRPSGPGPFPDELCFDLPQFALVHCAVAPTGDALVRMSAHLVELRRAAPLLLEFFERNFVGKQNIGPMGLSPRTLASGNPLRARYRR